MKNITPEFHTHLKSGATTVCRCWKVTREDGQTLGFTDHDGDLFFSGTTFMAGTGLDATALQTANGLSVDNTEATGALSYDGISEIDLNTGKYDGASVSILIVNWQNPDERHMFFNGFFGEITHGKNVFTVELRGLTEKLNKKMGRNFQKNCSAFFGDSFCRFDLNSQNTQVSVTGRRKEEATTIFTTDLPDLPQDWFVNGYLEFVSGENVGQRVNILGDRSINNERRVILGAELQFPVSNGDELILTVGCDKTLQTCRDKFQNVTNFQGFPYIPGEDWMMAVPSKSTG
jgi:uncharacterized phage protein (TIGR02218 family)